MVAYLPSQWSWEFLHNVKGSRVRRFRMVDMCKGIQKDWLQGTSVVLVVGLHMVGIEDIVQTTRWYLIYSVEITLVGRTYQRIVQYDAARLKTAFIVVERLMETLDCIKEINWHHHVSWIKDKICASARCSRNWVLLTVINNQFQSSTPAQKGTKMWNKC